MGFFGEFPVQTFSSYLYKPEFSLKLEKNAVETAKNASFSATESLNSLANKAGLSFEPVSYWFMVLEPWKCLDKSLDELKDLYVLLHGDLVKLEPFKDEPDYIILTTYIKALRQITMRYAFLKIKEEQVKLELIEQVFN